MLFGSRQQRCGLQGHDAFFVGGQGEGGDGAVAVGDAGLACCVVQGVEAQAQPGQGIAHFLPHAGAVGADAARENQGVEAADVCGECADVMGHAGGEQGDCFLRARIGAGFEGAHVATQAGKAFESAVVVEHGGDSLRVEVLFGDPVQHQAGVDGAAAGGHDQAVECGEPHGRAHAAQTPQTAQAGAASQMRHDDGALRALAQQRRQFVGDGVVRQAMKSVAFEAFVVPVARDGVAAGEIGLRGVKRGVEAGDLRHIGQAGGGGAHPGEPWPLMQRGEAAQGVEGGAHGRCDALGRCEGGAAMHDAVGHGGDGATAGAAKRWCDEGVEQGVHLGGDVAARIA